MDYYVDKRRVIAHIDMDHFAVQAHLKLYPQFKRKPCIAVQDNKIISVNYKAKRIGINRDMSIKVAKDKGIRLIIFKTPQENGKPCRQMYTEAGDQIYDVIEDFIEKLGDIGDSIIIERESEDGIYLDITEICEQKEETYDRNFLLSLNALVEGRNGKFLLEDNNQMEDKRLIYAAVLIKWLCDNIKSKTGYKSSAGISYNKLLVKIACGLNKRNNLTLIAHKGAIDRIYKNYPIEEMPGLKSGLGEHVINILNISKAIELRQFDRVLNILFDTEDGLKLWNIARGIDVSAVIYKITNNNITSSRKFRKGLSINRIEEYIFLECKSLVKKLNYDKKRNNRIAKNMRAEFTVRFYDKPDVKFPFNYNLHYYDFQKIYKSICSQVFNELNKRQIRTIINIKLIAKNFQQFDTNVDLITNQMSRVNLDYNSFSSSSNVTDDDEDSGSDDEDSGSDDEDSGSDDEDSGSDDEDSDSYDNY